MNFSPDPAPASSLETLNRPAQASHRGTDEKIAVADFQHLLNAPIFSEENTLPVKSVAEEILDISTEASAWLAVNAAGLLPAAEAVIPASSTAQTPVSMLEVDCSHFTLAGEALLSPVLIGPEIAPLAVIAETDNMPVDNGVFNAKMTETLATGIMPIVLNPASLPLFSLAESVTANPSLPVPHLQRADFAQGIATHLTWYADQSIGRAHIQINPPHLGAVEIQLHLRDKQLHAAFFSPHTEVCQRLQESLPVLHRLLDEHGLHLAQADVNQQAPDSDTHAHTEKTAKLFISKENTKEENKSLEVQPYQQTTLLDTWA